MFDIFEIYLARQPAKKHYLQNLEVFYSPGHGPWSHANDSILGHGHTRFCAFPP